MTDAAAAPGLIAVVTVNWNGWRNTLACLAALRQSQGADWRLYIVDNASTDDSLEHLSDLGDDVVLIRSTVNGGWTGGNNLGVERAMADGCALLFVLNNDAFVEPDTLANLAAFYAMNAEQTPILGPIEFDEAGERLNFVGATIDQKTGRPTEIPSHDLHRDDLPAARPTPFIRGSGIFAHRDVFAKIGGFDDDFYLNYDDTDWCLRAGKAGYPMFMLRDAAVRHIGSASIGGSTSPLQTYFLVRNALLFGEKHATAQQRRNLLRPFLWQARDLPRRLPRSLWMLSFMVERGGSYPAFRRGLIDYALRRFGDCPPGIRR